MTQWGQFRMAFDTRTDLLSHIVRALNAPLLLIPWPLASNEPPVCFSLLNSSFGGAGHTDRRDKPLEAPYSTDLIHAAFFCELKYARIHLPDHQLDCPEMDR